MGLVLNLALLCLLADGLIEHDAARDVLAKIGGQEEQLAVRAAVLLFVGDADRGKALADGAGRLGRYEFLFVAAPLRIEKGMGSPLNPIATF